MSPHAAGGFVERRKSASGDRKGLLRDAGDKFRDKEQPSCVEWNAG